jgi:hypothetical protein
MKNCSVGESVKLRAGQPKPVCGCPCVQKPSNQLILQTFGGERRQVLSYKATTELLASKDFVGMNPEGEFDSASYQATQYVSRDGDVFFSGQEHKLPTYVSEDMIPGVSELAGV